MRFWLPLLALLVGGGALAWLLLTPTPPAPPLPNVEAPARPPVRPGPQLEPGAVTGVLGGTWGGVVVDEQGLPVEAATVVLVRFEAGDFTKLPDWKDDRSDFDPSLVPELSYFDVSAQQKTDAQGRFRLSAPGEHRVQLVAAWRRDLAPNVVLAGQPGPDVRVVLRRGGYLRGRVEDPEGRPVANAQVEIFLQSIAREAPNPEPGQAALPLTAPEKPLARLVTLGRFLGRVLGPQAFGYEPSTNEAQRTHTASDGTFHFGPVDDSVQLEVVVDHPDYMWTEFDEGEDKIKRRPVLKPGETLERTYRLERGHWIEGRVVTDEPVPQGVGGVLIELRHVAQYYQHHRYRSHSRVGLTREDGTFRMSGLSFPPYVAMLYHGSFGSSNPPPIPADTKGLVWIVKSRGGLEGTLAGLTERPPAGRIDLTLEPLGSKDSSGRGLTRTLVPLDDKGVFRAEQLLPGTYLVTVRAGKATSRPKEVKIEARQVVHVEFDTVGGASVSLRVVDGQGRSVDPATASLVSLREDGGPETALGAFTTRAGLLDQDGLVPGRYCFEVHAPGFLPGRTEPFTLGEGRREVLPALSLRRPALLRVTTRSDRAQLPEDARLELQEGAGPPRPLILEARDLSLAPGPVSVRLVSAAEGVLAEASADLVEGRTTTLELRIPSR